MWSIPFVGLILAACGSGPQTSLDPQGPIARDIDDLWNLVFWIATVIFVIVQAALLVSVFRFRQKKGEERSPKQLHGNTKLEITWTIIPAVILASIAVPTMQTLFDQRAVPTGPDVVQIEVIGHQWWWEFRYPEGFVTANELHIPAGREVYLTMTSADVIHSFWMPQFNGKRDVVPGRVSNLRLVADEPTPEGEPWPGQCAEFCGLAHADMRIKTFVHDDAGWEAWLVDQAQPAEVPTTGAAAEGYATFNLVCTACHNATVIEDGVVSTLGPNEEYDLAPDLTHFGGRSTFAGGTFENTREHLRQWLDNPSSLKPMSPEYNDIPNGRILGMPAFGLDAQEIHGLLELLESWD